MKKLCIILSVIMVIGCLGYLAYDKVTDFMVKKTLGILSEDEALKAQIEAAIKNAGTNELSEDAGTEDEPVLEEKPAETAKPVEKEKNKDENSPKEQTVEKSSTPSKTEKPKKSGGTLTMDDLQGADKAYVMSIYNRFTASEVSTVSAMLSGGITAEEKRKIKSIVYAKVSTAEINKLYAIAEKYQ